MEVSPLQKWSDYCRLADLPKLRLLAHPGGKIKLNEVSTRSNSHDEAICAIGPEGGFTDDEIQLAIKNGWELVDLGPRVLRVETAAMVLAAAFNSR